MKASAHAAASADAAGQRCMAASVAVLVGDAAAWIPDIIAKAKTIPGQIMFTSLVPCMKLHVSISISTAVR